MKTTDQTTIYDHIELGDKPTAPAKPAVDGTKLSAKEAAKAVADGTLTLRDVEGPMSIGDTLAYRPAADRLTRNETVHINETTSDRAEQAMLKILGLANTGKRVKGKGEKDLDLSGLAKDERILDSAVYRKWERQPAAADLAAQIRNRIAAEQRQTLPVACKDLYLGKDGSLYLQGHAPVDAGNVPHRMTSVAYQEIADRAPVKKPLAYNLNSWCPTSDKATRIRRLRQPKHKTPLVFAAVGPKYNEFDVDKAVSALVEKLPEQARAKFRYFDDGGDWRFDVSLARPADVQGDLHELGLFLKSSDDGRAGVGFGAFANRWTCSNTLRIIHEQLLKTMRHVGTIERFVERFEEILKIAADAFTAFQSVWIAAKDAHPVDGDGKPLDVVEAIVRLCAARSTDAYRLNIPGVTAETLAGRIITSWEVEPEDSVQGLVNAVTRAAHEWKWTPSQWADEELEEQASQLLYARVIELPAPPAPAVDPTTLIELT